VLLLVLALAAAVCGLPQSTSADSQTGASRVALASVTDPRNRPLVDVSADDFVIQEAGASREILSVRPADYPIVILLDTGSEARSDFQLMQAVAHFIDRIGQRPIALGTFGNVPKLVTTFEDDRQTSWRGSRRSRPTRRPAACCSRARRWRARRFAPPARCSRPS
jgi:hypothetical protein